MAEENKIPDGHYQARAIAEPTQWGKASTGTKQFVVRFALSDPKWNGATLPWFAMFTDKTFDRVTNSLLALGWTGETFDDLSGIDTNEVQVTVKTSTHEGATRTRVEFINDPLSGGAFFKEPMADAEIKAFAQASRGRVAKIRAARGGSVTTKAAPTATPRQREPGDDDDIAF